MINNLNEKDFKIKVRNAYISVIKMEKYKEIRKNLVIVNQFLNDNFKDLTSDITFTTSKYALDKTFIDNFNLVFEMVIKEKTIIDKWHALSNSKKKHTLINNMLLFTLQNKFTLDREKSVYNKVAKTYTEKIYNDGISVRLYELFLQVAKTLNKI